MLTYGASNTNIQTDYLRISVHQILKLVRHGATYMSSIAPTPAHNRSSELTQHSVYYEVFPFLCTLSFSSSLPSLRATTQVESLQSFPAEADLSC